MGTDKLYAEVVVDVAVHRVDRPFTYVVPVRYREQVQPGMRVKVPFGRRQEKGYIVGLSHNCPVAGMEIKEIEDIVDEVPVISSELLALARWMAAYYLCPLVEALNCIVPARLRRIKRKDLEERKEEGNGEPLQLPPVLTPPQEEVLAVLRPSLREGRKEVFLLHGVTGSGKTEVYLRAIEEVLAVGRQALVLVPEISLTPQMVERFKNRFGSRVAVWHSALSQKERNDEWLRIFSGRADIVVGARSAVFAPLRKPGLIVIDEEHENTYKQEESPRYHAREVALMRAKLAQCPVILGSATPSLESFRRAETGEYHLLSLPARVDNRPLPRVEIVDLREELKEGNRSVFSRLLQKEMAERLRRGEQIILFLNRRGFSTFVVCRECGLVMKCRRCDVSLTYHAGVNELRCHYCGLRVANPDSCPQCGSRYIRYFGTGTQKIEEEVKRLFPWARVLRMDVDTTSRRGAHEKIINLFREGKADILIGTQMIAKGLDIPAVTLVGVVSADTVLNLPDFRAAERTFQLVTQVAGRAGRGKIPGQVVVQSYNPDHYAIQAVRNHDYHSFYRREMEYRQRMKYPPFTHLLRVVVLGRKEEQVVRGAQFLGAELRLQMEQAGVTGVSLLGPAPAPLQKLKDTYRWQMALKGPEPEELRWLLRRALDVVKEAREMAPVGLQIDMDPMGMI
ncbi:MAG: hypothetical protein PWQ31_860 [Eubacteriales bacterium]|nr:hypothetical protein [Eubacteriales bacterium]